MWESSEEDDKNPHAAIFDVKFGKKAEGAITEPRERKAGTLSNDLESVALAIEDSDPNTLEDNFLPTAKCIQDTKTPEQVLKDYVVVYAISTTSGR